MSRRKKTDGLQGLTRTLLPGLPRKPADLPDLEELDKRLEAAFLLLSDTRPDELCVWACACFLADGS